MNTESRRGSLRKKRPVIKKISQALDAVKIKKVS